MAYLLERHPSNPILVPQPDLLWTDKKVYNCGIVGNEMVFRAMGQDWVSRLGYAKSSDGINFKIDQQPVFEPKRSWESRGCEDPRITRIGSQYFIAYTAVEKKEDEMLAARLALATSPDLKNWTRHGVLFPNWTEGFNGGHRPDWSKAGAIFPEQIDGKYRMLFGDNFIWEAESDDLIKWSPKSNPILRPRPGRFDESFIEMGPPPFITEHGWLIFYHGITGERGSEKKPLNYKLGAALLSFGNIREVIWRSDEALLQAKGHERFGYSDVIPGGLERLSTTPLSELNETTRRGNSPETIFTCGASQPEPGKYRIYYSGTDTTINLATGTLEDILRS